MKMTEEQIFDEVSYDVAKVMAQLVKKYERFPAMIAEALTDSLGAFVAIYGADPETQLPVVAERIRLTDFAGIRLRHFGHKLAVAPDIAAPTPGAILHGVSHFKPE